MAPVLGQLAQQGQFGGSQGQGGAVRKLDQRIVELDGAVPQRQLLRSAPRQLGAGQGAGQPAGEPADEDLLAAELDELPEEKKAR